MEFSNNIVFFSFEQLHFLKTKTSGQLVLCGITLDLMFKLFLESFDYFGKNHEFCILIMLEILTYNSTVLGQYKAIYMGLYDHRT